MQIMKSVSCHISDCVLRETYFTIVSQNTVQ